MITLTEKRLQELEGRIPVYEATIYEHMKKLDEVNTFPKDVALLDKNFEALAEDFKNQINRLDKNLNVHFDALKLLEKSRDSQKVNLQDHQDLIDSLNSIIDMVHNKVKGHISEVDNQHIVQKTLIEHSQSLDKKVSEHQNSLNALIQRNNEAFSKANTAQIDSTAALNKTLEHDKSLQTTALNMQSIINSFAIASKGWSDRFVNLKDSCEKHIADSKQVKSYDNEIAEIRKDLSAIMVVAHSAASQSSDNNQLNDKIKILEKAIAEIYGLLKKHETR